MLDICPYLFKLTQSAVGNNPEPIQALQQHSKALNNTQSGSSQGAKPLITARDYRFVHTKQAVFV